MEIPFKIAEIDHLVLRCHDQPRMFDFYTRVLGLREERRLDAIGLIQLRAGASLIDLVPAAASHDPAHANVDHFCLGITVADLAAALTYLREHNVTINGDPGIRYGARGSGLSLYIQDPEANVIELKQMPAGAMPR